MIRTLWVAMVAFVHTVRWGIPILVAARRGSERLPCLCRRNPRAWARRILRAAGVEVEIEGAEHLHPDRAAVLVANHQSWFDVFVLTAHMPVDYRFVAKKELEGVPIFGRSWRLCGHVAIDRQNLPGAIATLERAGQGVREDRPTLIMFPEGTRSDTGDLGPFKKGAFVLAIQAGVPVVPAALLGTREIMPKGSWRIRAGKVRVRIGSPIPVEGMGHADRDPLRQQARTRVRALMEGGPVEPGPGGIAGEVS